MGLDRYDEDEGYDEDYESTGNEQPLSDILRGMLRPELRGAGPEVMDEALDAVMDSMSAAEAFNFAKALQQVGQTATQVLSDPTVNSVVRTAAPIAGGLAGTYFGGPLGAKVGSELGTTLVNALPGGPPARPPQRTQAYPAAMSPVGAVPPTSPPATVFGGSAQAAQAAVLATHPDMLAALAKIAFGAAADQSVNGVSTARLVSLLHDVVGRAAAHADELQYLHPEAFPDEAASDAVAGQSGQALYMTLMDADALEIAEALDGER